MKKSIKTSELFDCTTAYLEELFKLSEYPWDMLPKIKTYITSLIFKGIPGYKLISDMVLVGDNVKIHPSAVIMPPAIIGDGSEIRPGAYIRGNVIIGENCVIGNSTEIKNSILLNGVQAPHYNYIGDSVIGNYAHLGAGVICSNLKADGRNVVVHSDKQYETNLRKLGAILGDKADIGSGCVLNPGTVVGRGTRAYPLTALRGVYPEKSIIKSKETVVEIQ